MKGRIAFAAFSTARRPLERSLMLKPMKRKLMATVALALAGCLFGAVNSPAAVHYVDANGTHAAAPYTNWTKAARNIQDAVNAAATGDTVLVTNGLYSGTVNVTNALALVSVHGAPFTTIDGGGTVQCISLADGASLSGFTLTGGYNWNYATSYGYGGGVYCASTNVFLTNCVITGNRADLGGGAYGGTLYYCTLSGNLANSGGGARGSRLYNCSLVNNSAWLRQYSWGSPPKWYYSPGGGGGANSCILYNCKLTGNSANGGGGVLGGTLYHCTLSGNWTTGYQVPTPTGNQDYPGVGGGADQGTLYNCIVYSNTATYGANYYSNGSNLNNCCTTPMPTSGVGNITNEPLFVDTNGWSNLHLQSNSPCINAGNNAYVPTSTDLDGNSRIFSGTVDMGAYEYQGPGSTISYAWLQQFGLPLDGSADCLDPDHDGHNNWQEWRCGTCPTNNCSSLRVLSACSDGTNVVVTWQSVGGVNYFLECSTNLAASPCFTCVATNLPGASDVTTFVHTNAIHIGSFFYRVGVGN